MPSVCRVAVVGAGPLVGIHHCNALRELREQGVELACVCQRECTNKVAAERFGVKLYTDAYEMALAESLDGVVIATPTHLHFPMVSACIAGAQDRQANLNEPEMRLRAILVEKPICENLQSALKLVETAEKAGVKVLVGHQRRYSAFVRRARELVTNSNFGPLRGVNAEFSLLKPDAYFSSDNPKSAWRCIKGTGGPVLINLIHDVDLLRYITGHEVVQVFASTSSSARESGVEDTGAVTIVLDHGAVGTFLFSDAAPSPWSYEFTTLENKKYPPVPGLETKDCYHFLGAQRSLGFPSLRSYKYGQDVDVPGWDSPLTIEETSVEREDPLQVQMAHFVRVCMNGESPECTGRDGLQSLAVVTAILRSAETNSPVTPQDLLKHAAAANLHSAAQECSDGVLHPLPQSCCIRLSTDIFTESTYEASVTLSSAHLDSKKGSRHAASLSHA